VKKKSSEKRGWKKERRGEIASRMSTTT